MDRKKNKMTGKVTLVGAGIGEPDLITVKGLKAIQSADVIIHDLLMPQELLDEAKEGAELINAAKTRNYEKLSQDEINALLVERAKTGQHVVRLKGGDPYVYGRGAEEAVYCHEHGVACDVIPGVSSLLSVTTAAGFPLTYYGISSRFLTMMGYENTAKRAFSYDYESLAKLDGTIVMFMNRYKDLEVMFPKMLDAGFDPDLPVAMIYKGAMPEQEVLIATMGTFLEKVYARWGESPMPSLIVIGEVVKLRDKLPHLS